MRRPRHGERQVRKKGERCVPWLAPSRKGEEMVYGLPKLTKGYEDEGIGIGNGKEENA